MQGYRWYKFSMPSGLVYYYRNCTHADAMRYRERGNEKPLNFCFASKKEMAENDLTDMRGDEVVYPKRGQ